MTEQPYYLLPFDFTEISGKEVLVNELGDMIVSPKELCKRLLTVHFPRMTCISHLYRTSLFRSRLYLHWLRFTLKDYVKRSGSLSLGQVCISLL